jgi:heterodisulfide reductase subunit A
LNIELITLAEVESISGEVGNFQVTVGQSPRYIDPERCTGCGVCKEHCPVTAINEFNLGLNRRTAAYIQLPQAVPLSYAIDPQICVGCGLCEKLCLAKAVLYGEQPRQIELQVGAVVLAPGSEFFRPHEFDTYSYARLPNVVTSLEFERILSAGGPYRGHLMRPYDLDEPRKIAWLQCVGSRDINRGDNPYCSGVCCMYAIKQAVIAKEHASENLDTAIFFMDMRTHGKDFDKYYDRARHEHGVRFIRSRVHSVEEDPGTHNLILSYVDESGAVHEESFGLVVLSVGMQTPESVVELGKLLGVELDRDHFCATNSFTPVATSRPGVYVCGIFQGPKDIPQSVVQASAAATAAGADLIPARGTLTRAKEMPPETNIKGEPPRVGVFVCRCGINIAGVVSVDAVRDYARTLPGVVYVEDNLYTCSQDTQDKMLQVIKEQKLNRVVVAACTPRTHEPLFQETLAGSGLNKYLFEMANIRNQDSWVHSRDPLSATDKAKDLVRMSVAKVALLEPLPETTVDITQSALVVGGGVAGMVAALGLADQGYPVTIVEAKDELGGHARHIRKTWRGDDVQAYLHGLISRVENHKGIKVYLKAQLVEVKGFVGNFQSTIRFTAGESVRTITVPHGVAILAAGAHASQPDEYLYGRHPGVLLWHEIEDAMEAGKLEKAGSVVFIQCVGSREPERPYCSKLCCTFSIQQAVALKEARPEMGVYVVYRDIRTYGQREELYQKARALGVIFIRFSVTDKPVVEVASDGRLRVQVTDHILQRPLVLRPDFVTLASAIEARDLGPVAQMFKVSLNEEKFFAEAHPKLRPVDFATEGVFVCGLAHYPKPLDETIEQAQAAVSRATTLLARKQIQMSGQVASVNAMKCSACGVCVTICPFGAPAFNERGVAAVNQALCKGCGLCVASCRSGAIDLKGFEDKQIFAMIDEI